MIFLAKKGVLTFVLATALLGITGCNNNDNVAGNRNENLGAKNVRNNENNDFFPTNKTNQNLRLSSRASKNVELLKEVDQAHVIIRNNDAYVAVSLNQNHLDGNRGIAPGTSGMTGTRDTGTGLKLGNSGADVKRNYDGTTGTDNTEITGSERRGTTRTTGRKVGTGDNTNYKKVSSPLDKRIEKQVHAADNSIDTVYISYDTDFFGRMTNYSNDLRKGRNRDRIWNDFDNAINGVFR